MDGETQRQFRPQTTHGFLIFLTFLFSPSLGGYDPEWRSVAIADLG
jgi:hypothetical protein